MAATEPRVIHLDICPYGDLEIALATSDIDVTYRVSSHQLCSCSPFFRAMLGPQSSFAEASGLRHHQTSSATAASLFRITAEEEHDPTALATVLYVLHGRADHIPESVTFENLLEIAIICDYYDCAAAMRPWDEIWMKPLRDLASMPGYESWLFISWVFRNQDVFGQMTKSFSRNGVMVDGEFGVMVGGEVKRLDCHLPQGIIDAMADQRAKVGQEIVLACRDVLAQYDDDNTIRCQSSHKECDYIIYAALHRGFRSKSLFPADEDPHAHLMLNNIVQNVSGVVDSVTLSLQSIESLSSQNYGDDSDHYYYCRSIIDGVMQNLQAKPEQIKPLDLTAFSEELTSFPLEPSAPDSWVTWNALLRTGNFSTSSSLRPVRLEICKFGDIEITLKTATIHAAYLVSSHQLRTNSPVFRDLLGPDSEFGAYTRNCQVHSGLTVNTAERYRLEVKKDLDPAAFAAVLYIFHAGGKHLSGSIPFAGLVKVAVVCDYYNCSAALGPWYGKWVDHWKTYIVDRGYEDWLLIAWVFGEYQIFQTLTKNLSERGIMENNEFLIVSSEEPRVVERLSEHIPPVIIDSMIAQRNKACKMIAQACKGIYEKYSDDTASKCRSAAQVPAGKMCDHCIYGELHMGFKAAKLLTNSNGFNISLDDSPSRVVAELHKLSSVIQTLTNYNFGGCQHRGCAVDITGLAQIAQAALNGINQLPLTTFGRNQAERRAVAWDSVLAGAEEGAE